MTVFVAAVVFVDAVAVAVDITSPNGSIAVAINALFTGG